MEDAAEEVKATVATRERMTRDETRGALLLPGKVGPQRLLLLAQGALHVYRKASQHISRSTGGHVRLFHRQGKPSWFCP